MLDNLLRGYYYHDPDELGEDAFKNLGDDEVADFKQALLLDLLELVGEDIDTSWKGVSISEPASPNDLITNVMGMVSEKYWEDGKNQLRAQLREAIRDYVGGGE